MLQENQRGRERCQAIGHHHVKEDDDRNKRNLKRSILYILYCTKIKYQVLDTVSKEINYADEVNIYACVQPLC